MFHYVNQFDKLILKFEKVVADSAEFRKKFTPGIWRRRSPKNGTPLEAGPLRVCWAYGIANARCDASAAPCAQKKLCTIHRASEPASRGV